ncbi:hypothetical protein [Candidatus Formimonas warabiya]|uniref:DUF4426 domain-containing protein n=1 Tax=Formimonas warabiya TaxID=1761012 RepID=A0A3G1KV22_FORW1|nr:hypothetical protein [Candidatus Formimonas warabiya]ATW26328.1 hypothetical protein DCMF_17555 [Candidatus Formimonas warabiya]
MKAKKLFSLLAAVIMCVSVSAGARAADTGVMQENQNVFRAISNQIITPYWQNTDSIKAELSFSGAEANAYARVLGKVGVTKITATVTLQRKSTSGTLTTVKTWSGLEEMGNELVCNESYYVTRGYTYRLTISAKVYKGADYESVSVYDENYCE